MATVTGYTAARTQAIEDSNIISGAIDGSGHLILEAHDGSTVDAGYMLASVPDATTTHTGVVELATNAEGIAGTDTVRAITPAVSKAILDDLRTNGIIFTVPSVFDRALQVKVAGDTQPRIALYGDSTVAMGSGSAAVDTVLYRGGANILKTDDTFVAPTGKFGGSGPSDAVFIGDDIILADANVSNALVLKGQQDAHQAKVVFGSDLDTNLYRVSASALKTDGAFVASNVFVDGLTIGYGNKLAVSGFTGSSSVSGSTAAGAVSALNTSVSSGTNSMILLNGWIYEVIVNYQLSDNINSSYSITIPRIYTSGGSVLNGWVHYNGFNGHLGLSYTQVFYIKRIAGSNLTTGFGWTVQRYISGIAGTSFLDFASVIVNNVGATFDHAGLAALAVAV